MEMGVSRGALHCSVEGPAFVAAHSGLGEVLTSVYSLILKVKDFLIALGFSLLELFDEEIFLHVPFVITRCDHVEAVCLAPRNLLSSLSFANVNFKFFSAQVAGEEDLVGGGVLLRKHQ